MNNQSQPSFTQHPSAQKTDRGLEPPYWLQNPLYPALLQTQLNRYWYWGSDTHIPTAAVHTAAGHPSHRDSHSDLDRPSAAYAPGGQIGRNKSHLPTVTVTVTDSHLTGASEIRIHSLCGWHCHKVTGYLFKAQREESQRHSQLSTYNPQVALVSNMWQRAENTASLLCILCVLCVMDVLSAVGGPHWWYIAASVSRAWPSIISDTGGSPPGAAPDSTKQPPGKTQGSASTVVAKVNIVWLWLSDNIVLSTPASLDRH